MKKTILLVVMTFFIAMSAQAQKVKIKKDIATVDDVVVCKVEDDDVSRGAYYFTNVESGKKLLYFKWIDYGEFGYFEAYNADNLDVILFETEAVVGLKKWLVEKLYVTGALTPSGIDEAKLMEFSKKKGKEFSRRRNEN
ncbi:MAG: hypothetical protein EOO50_16550 [Flavobacterium sp.]|uniref:hypothetical protein n=1 Tax=Flavobacterium sp. TaxID=239 RepID=UPI001204711D|nr:hypothetical protein [Flavobacterium sp.]RZJ64188.1 MAG: hypothetical protein EOO50_16550 [Flavobacterium sp.]